MLVLQCTFGQFHLWRNENGLPLAFSSDEVLNRLKGGWNVLIKPDERRSGETPLLVDLIVSWSDMRKA